MYESYYGLSAKPFQLKPDPSFFFGSKGHKRAMAYLEYGLAQGDGFIVITGEVGAGKTTLVRNLFRELEAKKIVAAHIVNTHLSADETLRMVVSAFGLPYEGSTQAALLTRLEQFLQQCHQQGERALLVVDEAQNLTPHTVEELRMLSNFQSADKSLLQTFLLGQPEFRKTLNSDEMQQLRQRVIASYHLGPMDAAETQAYIKHRLQTVGWRGDPALAPEAFAAIFEYTGGIPRKINTFCDRLFLTGYLEELHLFGVAEVNQVIQDVQQEFELPELEGKTQDAPPTESAVPKLSSARLESLDERLSKLESLVISVLVLLKRILALASVKNLTK
ncbi:MAG: XrtA/PEP-CTERM system-associated ATPase [Pseudomonadota bacterium]